MEYLREEVVEKKEEMETALEKATCKIVGVEVGEGSDKTEIPSPDLEVNQPVLEEKKGKKKGKKRKGEKKDTGTATIGIIVVEESSGKPENSIQDVEVCQPVEGWTEQERKVSWVDRIKTIGEIQNCNYIIPPDI